MNTKIFLSTVSVVALMAAPALADPPGGGPNPPPFQGGGDATATSSSNATGVGVGFGGQGGQGGQGGNASAVGVQGQQQGIFGSGNSRNKNTNRNSNTNVNANVNKNHNSQGQGQDQGQHQGQGQGQSQKTDNANNSQQSTEFNDNSVYHAQKRNPVNTAVGGAVGFVGGGNDQCEFPASAGAQGIGFGISLGSSFTDDECVNRKNARELQALGQREAAVALLCMNEAVRQAKKLAGSPCPQDANQPSQAGEQGDPQSLTPMAESKSTNKVVRAKAQGQMLPRGMGCWVGGELKHASACK